MPGRQCQGSNWRQKTEEPLQISGNFAIRLATKINNVEFYCEVSRVYSHAHITAQSASLRLRRSNATMKDPLFIHNQN
ncbi:hypothetical protein PoB_002606000 [Plakobranchus ocellatus]|uniref:Uncharacterized protein n=1 Tax=Plakobranchus ocellatus TaxID=259542 RepID=A0AAV3ZWJ7_9GAST|nr:hypothetical protein PoB_002606000 [Plakobranchus ocellatus]